MAPACCFSLIVPLVRSWRPGIHDATPLGWLISAAYLAAAIACLRALLAARARADKVLARAWAALAAVMLLLGANKQLDVQTLLLNVLGRGAAQYRDFVQLGVVVVLAAALVTTIAVGLYWLRSRVARLWLACFGVVLLGAFVVLRAALFAHVGARIGYAAAWHPGLELTSIVCIGADAFRDRAR